MKALLLTFMIVMGSLGVARAEDADAVQERAALAAQQNEAQSALRSPLATHTCSFDFTTGDGDGLLHYCVTVNGNIAQLETPQSAEMIAVGAVGEGYGVCDATTNTAYFDYADFGDSGNWGPAKVVKQNAISVKIIRTTSDGIFTLTQTITEVPGVLPWIKVAMALKNNTGTTRPALLIRYADVDADFATHNNFDTTVDSAFGWNSLSGGAGFGLMIQNVGKGSVLFGPLAFNQPQAPDPCNLSSTSSLQAGVDGAIGILYNLNVPKNTTTTVTASYRGM